MTSLLPRPRASLFVEDATWTLAAAVSRRLPGWLYCLFVGVGLLLTAGQIFVLALRLDPEGFGTVAIGISLTQGLFAFGDLGLGRLADNTSRQKGERDHLRTLSFAAASAVVLGTVAVVAAAAAHVYGSTTLAVCCVLGVVTAWDLYPTQLRAQASEGYGDEVGAARRHFLWQNGPKLGLIVGALVTRDPIGCMLGGLTAAIVVSRPRIPPVHLVAEISSLWRSWLPALASVAAPFILVWSDTYFVAISHGIANSAGYVLIYRILSGVSYLYLPFGSLLLSRLNKGDHRAAWTVPLASLSITVPVLIFLAIALSRFGHRFFPDMPLDSAVVVPLVALNVFANVSHLAGTTLAAAGRFPSIMRCNLAGAAVAVAGHLLFTLKGSLPVAATVALAGVATAAVLQLLGARRLLAHGAFRPGQTSPEGQERHSIVATMSADVLEGLSGAASHHDGTNPGSGAAGGEGSAGQRRWHRRRTPLPRRPRR